MYQKLNSDLSDISVFDLDLNKKQVIADNNIP